MSLAAWLTDGMSGGQAAVVDEIDDESMNGEEKITLTTFRIIFRHRHGAPLELSIFNREIYEVS